MADDRSKSVDPMMGVRCLAGRANCHVAGMSAGAPLNYLAWQRASAHLAQSLSAVSLTCGWQRTTLIFS